MTWTEAVRWFVSSPVGFLLIVGAVFLILLGFYHGVVVPLLEYAEALIERKRHADRSHQYAERERRDLERWMRLGDRRL